MFTLLVKKKEKYLVKDNNLFTNLTTFNTKIIPGFENVLVKAVPSLMEGMALEEPSIFTACTGTSLQGILETACCLTNGNISKRTCFCPFSFRFFMFSTAKLGEIVVHKQL